MTAPPRIFDRTARRLRRDRYLQHGSDELERYIAEALLERLDAVQRRFATALVINTGHGILAAALRGRDVDVEETDHGGSTPVDEDRLDVGEGRFDLLIFASSLDTIDDVPGAMIAARRALKPDGLFLAAFPGAPSLPILRAALADAAADDRRVAPRLHPLIDVRAAGDLLGRAGFVGQVADVETRDLSYASLDRLFADLRASGLTNVLAERHAMTRATLDRLRIAYAARAGEDGRVRETLSLITMTGWKPA